jgi:type II secretion system protein N
MAKGLSSLGSSLHWPDKIERVLPPTQGGFLRRLGRISLQVLKIPKKYYLAFLGYSLYALALLIFFLYLTFPHQKLETRLIAMLEQTLSCQIRVNQSQWLFPIGLDWKQVHLHPQTGFKDDVVVDQARARVYLLPLLQRRIETDFLIEALGGKVRGSFSVQRRDGKVHYYFQESAQNLELQALKLDIPFNLEGRLRLDLEATWQDQGFLRGKGSGALELLGVKTHGVSANGLELPDLSFSGVVTKLALKNSVMTLEDFSAQGPDIEATGQGTVLLRDRWSDGLLNLATQAYLKEDLRQRFPVLAMMGHSRDPIEVIIKGTLGRPTVSINGMPLNLM